MVVLEFCHTLTQVLKINKGKDMLGTFLLICGMLAIVEIARSFKERFSNKPTDKTKE